MSLKTKVEKLERRFFGDGCVPKEECFQIIPADVPDLGQRKADIERRLHSKYGTSKGVVFILSAIPEPEPLAID